MEIETLEQNLMKTAMKELIQEYFRLRHLLESMNVGTWEWNVQTGEVRLNERWAEMIGYTLKELMPISIDTWYRHTELESINESEKHLKNHFSGETDYYECIVRLKHKNGKWVTVRDKGKVVSWTEDGKPLWMYGTHIVVDESSR